MVIRAEARIFMSDGDFTSVHSLRADYLAGQRACSFSVHVDHFAVYHGVVDALRRHHETGAAAG